MAKVLGPSIVYTTYEAYSSMNKHVASDIYICKADRRWFVGDVEMTADVSDFNLDGYATDEELAQAIANFVTQNDINTSLEPYAKSADVAATYATKSEISDFVTQDDIDTSLVLYATSADVASTYQTKSAMSSYYTSAEVDSAIADFVTQDDIDTSLAPYATSADVADTYATKVALEALSAAAGGAFHFRGSKDSVAALEALQDAEAGDVYQVGDKEYAYNGSEWVELGFNIDLSDYKTGDEITAEIEAAIDEALENFDDYDKSEIVSAKAQDAVDAAKEGIIADASVQALNDLFIEVKAAGYKGTRTTFISALADILNEKNNIVIAEGQDLVAAIAGSNLTSVAEALNAAEANSNIKFVADSVSTAPVSLNGNTVDMDGYMLDTNGNPITAAGNTTIKNANLVDNSAPATSAAAASLVVVPASATVTIKDSDIDTTSAWAVDAAAGSTVNLDNVDFNSSADPAILAGPFDSKPMVYADQATVNFTSGSIVSDTSSADDCGLYGIYGLNGATITLGDQATGEGPTNITNSAPIGTNNTTGDISKLTIYGGYYKSLMSHTGFMGVMYLGGGADVEIFGGEFDGGNYDIALPYAKALYKVAIHGGTFHGSEVTIKKDFKNGGSGADPDNTLDVIVIDGGKFAVEPNAEYIKAGYVAVKRGDWWYVEAE